MAEILFDVQIPFHQITALRIGLDVALTQRGRSLDGRIRSVCKRTIAGLRCGVWRGRVAVDYATHFQVGRGQGAQQFKLIRQRKNVEDPEACPDGSLLAFEWRPDYADARLNIFQCWVREVCAT